LPWRLSESALPLRKKVWYNVYMVKEISVQELKAKLDSGDKFYLIDARSAEDFEHNHIVEAINLPWGPEFTQKLPHVLPDKDAEIVVYGTNDACVMAKSAVDELNKLGYENLALLGSGFIGWMESGLALEFGKAS